MQEEIIIFTPTRAQWDLDQHPARFKVAVWGRRSGKSTYALNLAIKTVLKFAGCKVIIVCPTYGQAKDIYWRDSDMIPKYIIPEMQARLNESELVITFPNGSVLQFKGADRPETMRGLKVKLLIADEISEWRYAKETWEQVLMPTLSDLQGDALFIGTPKGENFFKDLYELGKSGKDNWMSLKIPTWQSGAPWTQTTEGKIELQRAKDELAEDVYMQEYGADFRKFTGLVFKEFDENIHVRAFEIKTLPPFEMGMDFGWTNPTTNIFTYWEDEVCYVVDDYAEVELPVQEHAKRLFAKRNKYTNTDRFNVGDSANPQTIAEFAKYGWHVSPVVKSKESIRLGIDRMSNMFKPDPLTKRPKLYIYPQCVNLIAELNKYSYPQNRMSNYDNKDELPEDAFDHSIDALRYIVNHHTMRAKSLGNIKAFKPIKHTYTPNISY